MQCWCGPCLTCSKYANSKSHPPFPSCIPELTTAAPQGFPATTAFEKKVKLQKSNYRDDNIGVRAATNLSWMDLCKDLSKSKSQTSSASWFLHFSLILCKSTSNLRSPPKAAIGGSSFLGVKPLEMQSLERGQNVIGKNFFCSHWVS